jgi:HEAT repeat protein
LDDTLSKLGTFVAAKDSRLACAAAVILAELAPRDSSLVKKLVDALNGADAIRRPFIIEALGRIGTQEAAAALVPLIKSEGPASEQALRAIAHTASAALKPLLKLVGHVTPALLEKIAECAGRTGDSAAFSTLFSGLANADVDTCRAIRGGLRTAMTSFDDKSKEHLRKELDRAFKDKALVHHFPALIALMKIAGDLGDVTLQNYILHRTEKDYPPHVRRAALQAIGMLHYSGEQRAKMAGKLLPLMFETDLLNLAEPALEAMRQAHLGAEHQTQLKKLLHSQSSRIREFAMQSLAALGSSRTLGELVACLDSADRSVREEALGALSRAPSAAGVLAERLLELGGGDSLQETARALAPQASKIPPKLLHSLAEEYVELSAGNGKKKLGPDAVRGVEEKRRAILSVFRSANSPELVNAVFVKARKLRENDEKPRAYEMIRSVMGMNGWTDQYRIELALSGLSVGPKDLARASRSNDHNLHILEDLLSSGHQTPKDLAKLINKDTTIDRRTLYYIGFHFVERMQHEREFGRQVLEQLAESRSEEGRQAKEKLVIEGLVALKGGKAGILEERAKVLLSASDMIAAERARQEREKKKSSNGNGRAPAKPAGRSAAIARAKRPSAAKTSGKKPAKKAGKKR